MYYIIYKITNKIDGKFYIGSHKTKNLDDGYMGSGKYLRRAQEKYGMENFFREILFVFDTSEEMYAKEAEIVNEDFLTTQNVYNIKIGGRGGFEHVNSSGKNLYGNNGKIGFGGENLKSPPFIRDDLTDEQKNNIRRKIAETSKQNYANGRVNGFNGLQHTDETKQKISETHKKNGCQVGTKNSQYGTMWIHNLDLQINKKINKNTPIPDGWTKGAKFKF